MSELAFFIDPHSKDELYRQIRKQVEYWIATGRLQPGDRLPTIRQLEQQLGVNRHTIRRAYLDLEQQGLLRVQRGSGVTVAPGRAVSDRSQGDPAVERLVEKTFREAARLGYDPLVFAQLVQRKAMVADRRRPVVALVECSAHQAQDLAAALQVQLGQAVLGFDLHAVEADPAVVPDHVRHVVVPAFHSHQVGQLLRGRNLQTITVPVEVGRRFVAQAAALLPTARPGVILRDRDAIPLYPEMVKRLLKLEVEVAPALMEDRRAVERLVSRSDLVFYSPPCKEFADQVVPQGKKKQEIVFEFTPEAIALVRRSIGL